MRFTIAAALLFHTATTSSSFVDDNQKQVLKAVQQVRVGKRQAAAAASAAANSGRRQLKARTLQKIQKRRRDAGILKNPHGFEKVETATSKAQECDPRQADVIGILACGQNYYCKASESSVSSMGGLCMPKEEQRGRRLQSCSAEESCEMGDFCNYDYASDGSCELCPCGDPAETCAQLGLIDDMGTQHCAEVCAPNFGDGGECQEYGVDVCDYSEYDDETKTGTVTCVGSSCFYDCCYDYSYTVTFGPDGNADDIEKTEFTYFFSAPYNQTSSLSLDYTTMACQIGLDGELCTGCDLYEGNPFACYKWDCTNIMVVGNDTSTGNTCDGPLLYAPIVDNGHCNIPAMDPCNICGEGKNLTNPDIIIGDGEESFSCQTIYLYGMSGYLPNCPAIAEAVAPVCCGAALEPCILCPDGGSVTDPDKIIPGDPGEEDATCGELESAAMLGIIPPDLCMQAKTLAALICGCGDQPIQDPCLVCPGDADVTNPDVMVPIPGEEPVSCADIQMAGRNALIPAAMCVAAQLGVPSVCGCGDSPIDSTPAPAEPTAAPIAEPTAAPVTDADPTDAPTDGSAGYAKRTALTATSFVAFAIAWVLAA